MDASNITSLNTSKFNKIEIDYAINGDPEEIKLSEINAKKIKELEEDVAILKTEFIRIKNESNQSKTNRK